MPPSIMVAADANRPVIVRVFDRDPGRDDLALEVSVPQNAFGTGAFRANTPHGGAVELQFEHAGTVAANSLP